MAHGHLCTRCEFQETDQYESANGGMLWVFAEDDLNNGSAVCECYGPDKIANPRLIAAAPDMLKALRDLTAAITSVSTLMDNISLAKFEAALAAIAKAPALSATKRDD
jgi:hypothetical protein